MRNSVGGKRTAGMGVGLKNTDARLRYLYGGEAVLSFSEAEDHTATATIVLPALGSESELSADPLLQGAIKINEGTHARVDCG